MKSLKHRIVESLLANPGQSDADLADSLNECRQAVNRTLYLELSAEVKRDDNLRWYALNDSERGKLLDSLAPRTSFDHLRGKSLFNVEASSKELQMHLNAEHRFFQSDFQNLDDQGKETVLRLFETLGVAMSHKFEDRAVLDDLIGEWSKILNQRVAIEQVKASH